MWRGESGKVRLGEVKQAETMCVGEKGETGGRGGAAEKEEVRESGWR